MRLAAFTLAVALFAANVSAAPVPGTFADPTQEARARSLQRELRCLVCQGESIDDSNAEFASVVRTLVRERIAAGQSDEEIKSFLVERYGDFVLMRPQFKPETYFLWLAPFALLILGFGVTTFVVMRAKKRGDHVTSE